MVKSFNILLYCQHMIRFWCLDLFSISEIKILASIFTTWSVRHEYSNVITHLIQLENINYENRQSLRIKVVENMHISIGILSRMH